MTVINNTVLNTGISLYFFNLGPPVFLFSGRAGVTGFKEEVTGRSVLISDETTRLINAFSQATSTYWADEGTVLCSLDIEVDKTDSVPVLQNWDAKILGDK